MDHATIAVEGSNQGPTSSGWVVADRNGKYQGNDGAECPRMPVSAQVRLPQRVPARKGSW